MFYLIAWVAAVVIGGAAAHKWLCVDLGLAVGACLFLGPIGFACLMLIDPRKRCPACRSLIPPSANICRYCREPQIEMKPQK